MTYPEQIKNILLSLIEKMGLEPSRFCRNPGVDFTRKRKLDFSTLIHFQLSMGAKSLDNELTKYAGLDAGAVVSKSAFFQQRKKLASDPFQYLFYQFNSHFTPILYKGKYQLLAADGSSFTYTRNPKDADTYYQPSGRSKEGFNQVHLVALYDLLSMRYTDAILQPVREKNEFGALCDLIDNINPVVNTTPIVIADRGFHAYNVFAHAIENNLLFLIRAKDVNMERLLGRDRPASDIFDIEVTRYLSRTHSKKKHLHPECEGQYRHICKAVPFSYIKDDKYGEYKISLRVLRFLLADGSYENVITNLPKEEFPTDEIKELYHSRWGIETSFCLLKNALGAERFHSKVYETIKYELWSRLILFNFCSVISLHSVQKDQKKKHFHQVNYSQAFQTCQMFLAIHDGSKSGDIEAIIRRHTLPIRKDRHYNRKKSFKVPVSFLYRF